MSYNLSLIIERKSKPHNDRLRLIFPSIKKVLDTILHHKTFFVVITSIPLSNNIVQRRVDEIATDRLCSIIRNTKCL